MIKPLHVETIRENLAAWVKAQSSLRPDEPIDDFLRTEEHGSIDRARSTARV